MNKPRHSLLIFLIITTATVLQGCGGGKDRLINDYSDTHPVNPEAEYAAVLEECVLTQTGENLCSLNKLPLLGMEKPEPTVADVMDRTLVSHQWMADRFEELLAEYPLEFLTLFKGLTAVVIDDDIRPAHYRSDTGAIYIDPAYLWVSVVEKQTINPKQDYRAGFDDELAFKAFNRYLTPDGEYAGNFGSLTDTYARGLNDASFFTARLLLHELAHVNDFLPYDSYDRINRNNTVIQAVNSLSTGRVSDRLTSQYRLQSTLWPQLGRVMFHGDSASDAQKELTAEQVGEDFEADAAADDYAYSTQFEDLAMLFEIVMMKYFWDLDFEQAFVTPEGADPRYCNDFIIGWGALSWIGDEDVKQRAQFVTNALLPDLEMSQFYQDLEMPRFMSPDSNWCLPSSAAVGQQKTSHPMLVPLDDYGYRH